MDEVRYVDDMPNSLRELQKDPTLLTLNGVNTDSKKQTRPAAFDGELKKKNREFMNELC